MLADQSDTNNRDLDKKKTWIPPPPPHPTHLNLLLLYDSGKETDVCTEQLTFPGVTISTLGSRVIKVLRTGK